MKGKNRVDKMSSASKMEIHCEQAERSQSCRDKEQRSLTCKCVTLLHFHYNKLIHSLHHNLTAGM